MYNKKKTIIIVGSGWYGLHTYIVLKKNYSDNFNLLVLEKKSDIFDNSSNYNQNRLHLGYHYPRSEKTRKLCEYGYDKFIEKYRELVDFIDGNYYLISSASNLDFETYKKIFNDNMKTKNQHTFLKNNYFNNIDGKIINTKEKVINSEKAKKYFSSEINKNEFIFNYNVDKIEKKDNKIIINDDLNCDYLIDCSFNQLQLSKKKYIYEYTISLLYERNNFDLNFDSITLMDGEFFSLYPRDITKNKYTLTHVKYTPIVKSLNINDILNFKISKEQIEEIKSKMENDVIIYYPDFLNHFSYYDYFISYKCKLISNIDTRECIIENSDNIISVNCGKITGIFEFEDWIKKYFCDNKVC